MANTGWLNGANAESFATGTGVGDWVTWDNALSNNATNSTVVLTDDVKNSNRLFVSDFGMTIPGIAEIQGFEILIKKQLLVGDINDNAVRLMTDSATSVGTEQSMGTAWTAGYQTIIYGGPTDLMGWAPLPIDVNSTTFGIGLVVATTTIDSQAGVDVIQVRVYYKIPGSATLLNMGAF